MRVACRLAVIVGLVASPMAVADSVVGLRYGEQSSLRLTAATLRLSPTWATDLGRWKVALHPEAELGALRYRGSRPGSRSAQFLGGSAILRVVRGEGGFKPYAEIGLGGALFSRTSIGSKSLSTAFQFSQTLGLGVEMADSWLVGWRFSHYSNADIKQPNDGIDMHQLFVGIRF